MLRGLVIGALWLGPAIASAELVRQPIDRDGDAPLFGFVGSTRPDGTVLARQVIPARTSETADLAPVADEVTAAVAQSRTVYLNKNGVTLMPGDNDARTNRSTVVSAQTAIPAWNVTVANWDTVVTCMRELFAPFNVRIVDTDPGNVAHIEAVFGGSPTQVGMSSGVLGVSPFTTDCSIIENSVVFTFTGGLYAMSPREACEVMAQEVAHSYGLDHELLASDPMTYLDYRGNRSFRDQAAQCGEDTPRACGINGNVCRQNQNSVQMLTDRLGIADTIGPTLVFSYPPNNSIVPPGFRVKASGSDNQGVMGAALKIDGIQYDAITGPGPFVFTTSPALADGPHTIVVEIDDGKNFKAESKTVTVQQGAQAPGEDDDPYANGDVIGGCAAGGDDQGAPLLALGLAAALASRRRARTRRA